MTVSIHRCVGLVKVEDASVLTSILDLILNDFDSQNN